MTGLIPVTHSWLWAHRRSGLLMIAGCGVTVAGVPRVLRIRLRLHATEATKVDYIHANPVRRGLVTVPDDWPYSSYAQLALGAPPQWFACDSWDVVSP